MCGQYALLLQKNQTLYGKIKEIYARINREFEMGDIFPGQVAPVITETHQQLHISAMEWGFPTQAKQLIFNARAETLHERVMFRDLVDHCRCVVPTSGFYEFSSAPKRTRFLLQGEEHPTVYLAGIYQRRMNGLSRFVIITMAAQGPAAAIHDRMPVMLRKEEVVSWLAHETDIQSFIRTPYSLNVTENKNKRTSG